MIGTVGEISSFLAFEEKTIRGTLIGSRKDMEDVIRIAEQNKLEVVSEAPVPRRIDPVQRLRTRAAR